MRLIRQDFVETFRIKQNFWKNRIFCLSALSIRVLRYIEFFETYGKTRFYPIQLIFVGNFKRLEFILFLTQSMDNFLSNEYRRSFVRQRLASVVPRKISMKNSFLIIFMDFENPWELSKMSFSSKSCEEPEKRVFVAQSSCGTHLKGNYPYFALKMK